jgi:signal transduction histidine kinase
LLYFSAFSAAQLYVQGNLSESRFRREWARRLATERDPAFENAFAQIEKPLLRDRFVNVNVASAFQRNSVLQDLINDRYLDSCFFSAYDYGAFAFTDSRIPLVGNDRRYAQLEEIFNAGQDVGSTGNLRFWSNPDSAFCYLARICYENRDGLHLGTVFLQFTPKPVLNNNVYVDLLTQGQEADPPQLTDFAFAVYKHGNNRRQEGGNFPRRPDPTWTMPKEKNGFSFFEQKDKTYWIYAGKGEVTAVLRTEAESPIRVFTLFSFLFCFNLGVLALVLLANRWLVFLPGLFAWRAGSGFSLRGRIQMAMVAVILLAFFTIATVTLLYNQRQLANYHRSRLERKVASVTQTARNLLAFYGFDLGKKSEIRDMVQSIAQSERLVVNLYDREGHLLHSSKPAFFDRKMVADRMDPLAYFMMEEKEEILYVQTEYIGRFAYQAAYAPLKDDNGIVVAYLNIPYDSSEDRSARHDNAELLGTLLNVYVLLLLIAGAVALAVANSVTRPLAVVADKLRLVQLGRRNEPLEWKNDDEIGSLIDRYNEMIQQLEENSAQLARTQKEVAWREMAKQVAHEIKNPLTPMKLNLQLLDRALQGDPERGKEMFKRVSASLIEQIDGLAHIASEFSNFAQMPQARHEKLCLNTLVGSVCELFRDMPGADLTAEVPEEPLYVWADKNQLIRVLNNLLKNAEQAIPETHRGRIAVRVWAAGGHARIAVRDNGTGIPREMLDKVFVPNFTTKSSGMGLGLAMSKSIVEAADGRIWFETRTGEGTVFFLDFPLMKSDTDPSAPSGA